MIEFYEEKNIKITVITSLIYVVFLAAVIGIVYLVLQKDHKKPEKVVSSSKIKKLVQDCAEIYKVSPTFSPIHTATPHKISHRATSPRRSATIRLLWTPPRPARIIRLRPQ
jgi:hypothetical protein